MSEWQDISSAPKDKAFLAWDGHNINFAWWEDDGLDISDWSHKAGWQVANAGYDGDSNFDDSLTHWYPIPAPPSPKE